MESLYTLFFVFIWVFFFNALKHNTLQFGGGKISHDDTSVLKGLAILMVVIGHVGQTIPGLRVFTPLGAIGVGVFLVCSGYGIEKSFNKNGRDKYWYKRMVNVWLPYVIVETLFLPLHWNLNWIDLLKDFTLVQPLHPFGWYMRFLFAWYILFYVFSFLEKYKLHLLLLSAVCVWVLTDSLHAQNAFSFSIGVLMAQMKDVCPFLKKRYIWIGLFGGVLLFLGRDYVKVHYHNVDLLWKGVSLFYYGVLTMTVIIVYKILSNKGVKLPYNGLFIVGAFSYELYLVHGYAYSILITPASVLMITEFVIVCIIGTYLLNRFNKVVVNALQK